MKQQVRRPSAPQQPEVRQQEAPVQRGVTLSTPLFVLILTLVFVCGLLAGSMLSSGTLSGPGGQPAPAPQAASRPAPQPEVQQQAQGPQASPAQQAQIRELEAALARDPVNRDKLVALGNLYFDTGRHADAISSYEAALSIQGDDAGVLTDCGVMYRATGQFEKALEKFDRAMQVQPGHAIAMFNKGVVLNFDLHRHDEALKVWRELAAADPGFRAPGGIAIMELIRQVEDGAAH